MRRESECIGKRTHNKQKAKTLSFFINGEYMRDGEKVGSKNRKIAMICDCRGSVHELA